MRQKVSTYFYAILGVLFVISFGYLFLTQHLNPTTNTNIEPNTNSNGSQNPSTTTGPGALKQFTSYDDFKKFITDNLTTAGVGGGVAMHSLASNAVGAAPAAAPAPDTAGTEQKSPDTTIPAGPDYSQTNIQVAGVDEADIIKSDGSYFYIVSGNSLAIVQATPAADAKIVSTVALTDYPQGLYISDDHTKLAVYGSQNQVYYPMGAGAKVMAGGPVSTMMPIRGGSQQTFFKVYDITDKTQPKLIRDVSFEGSATDSRMVGNFVYFITQKNEYNWFDGPYPLPRILDNGKVVGGEPDSASYRFPSVYYFPFPYDSSNLTTVSAINLMDATAELTTQNYVLENGQQIYVSPEDIYITYTKNLDQQQIEYDAMKSVYMDKLTAVEKGEVQQIEAAPNYILNKYERQQKATIIFQNHLAALPEVEQQSLEKIFEDTVKQKYQELADQFEQTSIYRIAFKDGALTYQGTADVPGMVINQFAMDESNGYFRIATTKDPVWIPYTDGEQTEKPYNNLYVLGPDMKRVGAVEHLAEGEQIYSVRFMQNRAYMVTFKQVDPLFVIDVADPTAPKVLGTLNVPGYSSYLHPLDENTLIGLGKETETNQFGAVIPKGIKLSLFDVTDVANPKETASYSFNTQSSDSPALYDHKAFLYSGTKDLLVIPLQVWSAGYGAPKGLSDNFMGAAVFTVTKDSIALKGFVKHASDVQNGYTYDQYVKRSMYIDDVLYTLSDAYLKANNLSDLKEIKSIALPALQPVPVQNETKPSQGGATSDAPPAPASVPPAAGSGGSASGAATSPTY